MNELLPILLGALLGATTFWLPNRGVRVATLIGGSVAFGAAATFITGEHLVSWGFVLVDIPIVLAAATVAAIFAPSLATRILTVARSGTHTS